MKNLNSKSSKINIIFSSFLIIGYIICAYFFSTLANQIPGKLGFFIRALILIVFGLLLFYATRVGEGKQVRRFSLAVLLLVDLPALYIILASFMPNLPFSASINPELAQQISAQTAQTATQNVINVGAPSVILMLACVALGYGLPYTFFSGYELQTEDEAETEEAVVEGGIAQELAEDVKEEAAEADEEVKEEATEAVTEVAEDAEAVTEAAEDVADADAESAEDAENEDKKEEE